MNRLQSFGVGLLGAIFGMSVLADPHVVPSPAHYKLGTDLELSSGRIVSAGTQWYQVPDVQRLRKELAEGKFKGDHEWAKSVVFGYDLFTYTYKTIGEKRSDGRPVLARGNVMSCSSCHVQGGTVPYAWPFFRTMTHFGLSERGDPGEYWGNLGYHRDARIRARDCARNCGGHVEIPKDSYEMNAMIAWMTVVREGIYEGEGLLIPELKTAQDVDKIPGARVPMIEGFLDIKADPVAGEKIFSKRCAFCHGEKGQGQWGGDDGYIYPPLSGEQSFSHAGGPVMIPVGASFIFRYMPLNTAQLTKQAAMDIMAYVSTLPRPSRWWQDYYFRHAPCSRPPFLPLHVGAVPKGYPFSAEQAQFGPWREIAQWLSSDECKRQNPPTPPELGVGFDSSAPVSK